MDGCLVRLLGEGPRFGDSKSKRAGAVRKPGQASIAEHVIETDGVAARSSPTWGKERFAQSGAAAPPPASLNDLPRPPRKSFAVRKSGLARNARDDRKL
jgi:hypothetical protein